jgi:type IV secretion system protein VirB4
MSDKPFYDLLLWNFISADDEGLVVQKDGKTLQKTYAFCPPDLDTADEYAVERLSFQFNDCVKRLPSGWALQLEVRREVTQDYYGGDFDHKAAFLIDSERRQAFEKTNDHYISRYFITLIHKTPNETAERISKLFVKNDDGENKENDLLKEHAAYFLEEANTVLGILANHMAVEPLDNQNTLSFLHSSISFEKMNAWNVPKNAILLDRLLPDTPLHNGSPLILGDYFIPIIGVNDFPSETYPAMFDALNKALVEYRWVTRFICFDKDEAKKYTEKKRKQHEGNRVSFIQSIFGAMSKEGSGKTTNHAALLKANESIETQISIEKDEVGLGIYQSNIMLWDKDRQTAMKKAAYVRNIINTLGFTCKLERFNELECYRGMMPGNYFSGVREIPIVTTNLSHIIPLSAIWAGMPFNKHAFDVTGCGLPHMICSTNSGTPFFLNLNPESDVGHTALFGQTGGGKSTFLNFMEAQFLKYKDSQIFVIDKGRSCRKLCMALGGLFYEPAGTGVYNMALQPLADLESDSALNFATEWIECLLILQGMSVNPRMTQAIRDALMLMAELPVQERTLTSFNLYVKYVDEDGRERIKEGLINYLIDGKYGKIFDSNTSDISLSSRFIAFEMESLMPLGEQAVAPALSYLFNFIEKKFDGRATLLVLDEAWVFLRNPVFSAKITEWLKVLRKKNVYVVFATQDVADVVQSPLRTTIVQQCLTKLFTADDNAMTPALFPAYQSFGLTDAEIINISKMRAKRDYFYKSPIGTRQFRLDLGKITLAFVGGANHKELDEMLLEHPEEGYEFCEDILKKENIEYKHLIDDNNNQNFLEAFKTAHPKKFNELSKFVKENNKKLYEDFFKTVC